ncbi:uncharacterized protein LOC134269297 [Saccostrea cucullata]|uniref:uncharacterized protein LOC134269297 n=1 Tax=Saccostrea cuccullata TaxID=36930 RepID=UPI002ECFCF7D
MALCILRSLSSPDSFFNLMTNVCFYGYRCIRQLEFSVTVLFFFSPKSPKLIRLAIDPEADLTDDCIITILKRPFCATKKLFRKRRGGGYSFLVRYSSKRFSKWSWKIKGRTTEKIERYRRKKNKEI